MNAAGVKASAKALMGDPAEQIVDFANSNDVDLIAMATHRGSAIARGILGSVTDRVLHSAGRPVMVVHPENLTAFSGVEGQPETVLVPLDGSERSASVVDLALGVAKAVNAEVIFFRAVQVPYYGLSAVDAAYFDTGYSVSRQRVDADEYLKQFRDRAAEMGVTSRSVVATGSVHRLLEEMKTLERPLVIMSTRGESGIKRWVLGSVTDKVIRSSGLPVLVVPPADDED